MENYEMSKCLEVAHQHLADKYPGITIEESNERLATELIGFIQAIRDISGNDEFYGLPYVEDAEGKLCDLDALFYAARRYGLKTILDLMVQNKHMPV